jgi:hypothetical protein
MGRSQLRVPRIGNKSCHVRDASAFCRAEKCQRPGIDSGHPARPKPPLSLWDGSGDRAVPEPIVRHRHLSATSNGRHTPSGLGVMGSARTHGFADAEQVVR